MKKLLVFVVLLAAGAGAAYHFGYLDRLGLGGLGATRLIPKDPNLLAYFGPDSRELLLLNATEVHLKLSDEEQRRFEQDWKEFYTKTGVNVSKDVDAVGVADGLAVVRGRFDWSKLSVYLQSEGYTLTELAGVPGAEKSAAADVALDGKYLLIGPRATLANAIERKRRGAGLNDSSPLVKAVDELGWKHTLVGGMVSGSRLANENANPQIKVQSALGAIDSTADAFELRAIAVTGSKAEGEVLHSTLEVLRKGVLLEATVNPLSDMRALREPLEKATLEVDEQGRVRGFIRIPYAAAASQASANLSPAQLANASRTLDMEKEDGSPAPSAQPPVPAPQPTPQPATGSSGAVTPVAAPFTPDWKPPVLGLFLLVIALVTKSAKERPGLFNVLLHPLFLVPFLVSTLGVFVFRWTGHSGGAFDILARPMPEWHRFLSVELAQPVALSAAIPMLFAIISGPVALLRRFAAGLGVGFSAYLAVMAFAGSSLPLIPPAYTLYWYAGNAVAALLMARITLPSRRGAQSGPARPARPVS